MKIDKEYPATHSMETAWYCVDEDGNVAIFQIEDNGPVPEGYDMGWEPEGLFWYEFSSSDEGMIRYLPLTTEQIEPLLIPKKEPKRDWEKSYGSVSNYWWNFVIIKIDMKNLPILEKALALNTDKRDYSSKKAVCISKKEGLFLVDFAYNQKGVILLEKNDAIQAVYDMPEYWIKDPYDEEDEVNEEYKLYPVYLYRQNYWPYSGDAVKYVEPRYPLKITQLPKDIQSKVFKMPFKFKDIDNIQLAEHMPVKVSGCPEYVYDGKLWSLLKLSDDTNGYYCEDIHKLILESEFKQYLEDGSAEEFDWNKHRELQYPSK
jgi:hypothetical protein